MHSMASKGKKMAKVSLNLDKNRGSDRISGQDRDHCENIKLDLSCSLTKSNTNGGDIYLHHKYKYIFINSPKS